MSDSHEHTIVNSEKSAVRTLWHRWYPGSNPLR